MTTKPLTDNERIKAESDYLRGHIKEGLADLSTPTVSADDAFLLKFLGATQQDDRDTRLTRKKQGLDRDYRFMLRLRLPGGLITPAQWLIMDQLSEEYGNRTLKLTTRQSIQIHGILKKDLQGTVQRIHHAALGAIASSGDATRNVMVSLHPGHSAAYTRMAAHARDISRELEPRTHAYHEIWLNEKRLFTGEEEPLYGKTYLPRKFKIAFTLPPDNDVDIYAHDLGFIAIVRANRLIGYNVLVGGGMGCAYGNKASFPRLADNIGFCTPEQVSAIAREVLTIHRDYSDRTDRKLSRLRYTIANRGIDWFKKELEQRTGIRLQPAREFTLATNTDPADSSPARLTLFVEGGRVQDEENGTRRLKTALREIARIHRGTFLLSANQNLVIDGLTPRSRARIESILTAHGIDNNYSGLRLHSGACSSLPFCPMAFTGSERVLPGLISELEPILKQNGLWLEPITARMTGCPNGCTRPYVAQLAFVGKAPGKYNIWLGGAANGSRLAYLWRQSIPVSEIAATLEPLFRQFAVDRLSSAENFGDWTYRRKETLLTPQA